MPPVPPPPDPPLSSVGQVLSVYDSKFKGSHLSSPLTHQLCQIYKALIKINKDEEESAGKLVMKITLLDKFSSRMEVASVAFLL